MYDIFTHSSSWNHRIIFDFLPLTLAVKSAFLLSETRDPIPLSFRSFEEFELAQQLLDGVFWTRLQGQAGGDVLRLLDPKLVGHAGLCERL